MSVVTEAEVKGLFYHLVKAVGGVEAAGAFLKISHQRVSQLQSPNNADMPTVMQIATLEHVVGQGIVTGAMARAAEGGAVNANPEKEIGDVVMASADVLRLERADAHPRAKKDAALKLVREATDVADAYGAASTGA